MGLYALTSQNVYCATLNNRGGRCLARIIRAAYTIYSVGICSAGRIPSNSRRISSGYSYTNIFATRKKTYLLYIYFFIWFE